MPYFPNNYLLEGGMFPVGYWPTGGSGAVTGGVLITGVVRIYPVDCARYVPDTNTLHAFVGDTFPFAFQLKDDRDTMVDLSSAQMSAKVTTLNGDAVGGPISVSKVSAIAGYGRLVLPAAATANPGTFHLTINRNNGTADRRTFGPVILKVSKR